jgi:hypothetical protein
LVAENIVYAGGTWNLLRSNDGGDSWPANIRDSSGNFHVDLHTLSFDSNGALYVGTDGGIVMHSNPATAVDDDNNWNNLNGNLSITQFYSGISVHPTNPLFVLGGTQDNGVLRYTGSMQWNELHGGDGGQTAMASYGQDTIMWYEVGTGPSDLMTSTNGGGNWVSVKEDLDEDGDGTADFGLFGGGGGGQTPTSIVPFVLDPNDPQTVHLSISYGTETLPRNSRIWRTTTGALSNDPTCGKRWCKNSPLLPPGIGSLAVAPSNSNIIYAGGMGSVNYTNSGGGTCTSCWTDISEGLPNRYVTDIAVHPTRPTVAYATLSGFCNTNPCPAGQGHVFINVNLTSWSDISNNLPDVPVNTIVLDAVDPEIIYIGTDLGVFRAVVDFAGQMPTWEYFSNGLPNSPVFDMVMNLNTRTLLASTFGRGVFRLSGEVFVDSLNTCLFPNGALTCDLNTGGPFQTVSDGVSAAAPWNTLFIRSGSYNEPMTINKRLELKAWDGTVTIGR